MKNQEERVWLTTIFAQAMMEKLSPGNSIEIQKKNIKLDELKGKRFICALKSKPLVNFLVKKGVEAKFNDIKFQVLPGDRIMVVNPNVKLHKYEENQELPEYTTVTVTEYLVK